MNKLTLASVVLISFLGGMAGVYMLTAKDQPTAMISEVQAAKTGEPLYYRNPMNPAITSPVPAQDSMGMDYIPVFAEGGTEDEPEGTVKIDPVTVQNIGVRTSIVEKKALARTVRAVGRVTYDETRLTKLHLKTEGWVEKLRIAKTGEQVNKGDILMDIYSPQLVSSQQEYLLALNNYETFKDNDYPDIRQGGKNLLESARERLLLLDVPEHQIEYLNEKRLIQKAMHLHSPYDGIVMNLGVSEGQFITPATELYMLADLSKVWVLVDVYEQELPWVHVGDTAKVKIVAMPDDIFEGQVTYIYPYLEKKTRTAKVRIEFDNSDLKLKPDMFAKVVLSVNQQDDALVIPSEAIIRSGTREQVFVMRSAGKFEPRMVKTGLSSNGDTQITDGLSEGEEIVVSAQFLIDSESKLREATAKMMRKLSGGAGSSEVGSDARKHGMPVENMSMDSMDMSAMSMDDKSVDSMSMKNMQMTNMSEEL